VALCTAGIGSTSPGGSTSKSRDEIEKVLGHISRLDMKNKIRICFCRIVKTKPETTYDNFGATSANVRAGLPAAVCRGRFDERTIEDSILVFCNRVYQDSVSVYACM